MQKLLVLSLALVNLAHADMFRGNPGHTGVYSSKETPSLQTVKWKFKTKGRIFSSPVISGGVAYFGSTDHNLYAVDASNGTERWKVETQGRVNSSPAVSDGVVYFTSGDGNLYAVDGATGKTKWKFRTLGERRFSAPGIHGAIPRTEVMPDPFDVFLSSPTVVDGVVYFGSGDHHVYAVNAASGELKWKFETGNVVHTSPAVADGVLYIGSWDRNLYALDAANGSLIWKFQTGDDKAIYNQVGIASSAAVSGGMVFFGCRDGHFYAVDAKSGVQKWKHNNNRGWVIASPAVWNGIVYFPTSDGQRFKALEADSGKVVFNVGMKAISFSSPAIVRDVAFFGTSDGWLHAIDIKTGAIRGEFQTDGSKENGAKYTTSAGKMNSEALYPDFTLDGMLVGLDRMYSMGSILSSPIVSNGILYVGSGDGNLYALQ
ncbi:MAG: PQQ-binding-like beta-propeller repeat protein [Bryobacteraceae bacterium]